MMDTVLHSQEENIRKIEDIIDIQKAKGNYNSRQVAFALPSDTDSTVSANLVKSLETGLSNSKIDGITKKKLKKFRAKRFKSQIPDVISWPSDSDITVLRMKLFDSSELKEKVGNLIPGDGLHHLDSSSMVNLATLMLQSQSPSKHSIIEEYLLPLTSWEEQKDTDNKVPIVAEEVRVAEPEQFQQEVKVYEAMCSHKERVFGVLSSRDSGTCSRLTKKCKIARFLRLYFCPCCTCLYKMEKMPPSEISQHNLNCC
ncbi:uncharacterized protein [Choristoneura fumiferana]|uniref:uncharacterized protein n=1 Tax=Choristoneura fumiferana TaxID=7141 RepID=UPI003D15D47B